MYCSPDILRAIKYRRAWWVGLETRIRKLENVKEGNLVFYYNVSQKNRLTMESSSGLFWCRWQTFWFYNRKILVIIGLLGWNAVWTCTSISTFRGNIVSPSTGLNMETVCLSETLVSTYKSTRLYYPEDQHRHLHRRENRKSHRKFLNQTNTNLSRTTIRLGLCNNLLKLCIGLL
jgi:hypothetical protein